jgi:hypothetical protein
LKIKPILKLDSIRTGFAAGCEARLCLAVDAPQDFGLSPWFGLWPINLGLKPGPRAQPHWSLGLNGEAEPRLTSGGEAGACGAQVSSGLDLEDGISHPAAKPELAALIFHEA